MNDTGAPPFWIVPMMLCVIIGCALYLYRTRK